MKIQDMNKTDRPREKALQFGLDSLSDQELICLLLGSGISGRTVQSIAEDLLQKTDSLASLHTLKPSDLMVINGIGQARALQLLAALQLSKRALKRQVYTQKIWGARDAAAWLQSEYGALAQEHFIAVFLDSQHRILFHKVLAIGTLSQAPVHPRDLFREAFACNAACILLAHNHPSQDLIPSMDDLETTQKLIEAAELCGIPVLDHLIISRTAYFSFQEHHLLDDEFESDAQTA